MNLFFYVDYFVDLGDGIKLSTDYCMPFSFLSNISEKFSSAWL